MKLRAAVASSQEASNDDQEVDDETTLSGVELLEKMSQELGGEAIKG